MQARSCSHNHPFTIAQSLSSIRYRALIVMQTLSSSHCHVDIIIHQPSCIHCHAFTVLHLLSRNRRLICKSHNSYHPYTFMHHPFHTYHDYHALYVSSFSYLSWLPCALITIKHSLSYYHPLTMDHLPFRQSYWIDYHSFTFMQSQPSKHYQTSTIMQTLASIHYPSCNHYYARNIMHWL